MTGTTVAPEDIAKIEYSFDSCGFFLWRSLLAPSEVEEARRCMDALALEKEPWHAAQVRAAAIHRDQGLIGSLGMRLYDHQVTRLLVGYPHRLLESYAIERDRGPLDLHGGNAEFLRGTDVRDISARSWVEHGRIYSLRVKVLIYLDDVLEAADGRLSYIEGSHKAAFSFHRAFPEGRAHAKEFLRTVELRAGDVVWLNEALLHGAGEKVSQKRRRLFAFTYGPAFMTDWNELDVQSQTAAGYHAVEVEGEVGRRARDG